MRPLKKLKPVEDDMKRLEAREVQRYELYRDLSIVYEGTSEAVPVRPPDLSTRGMFIHTTRLFPLGSVLKVRFRLRRSGFIVQTRAEVRHCEPGSGVGVEFLHLDDEALQAIEQEIAS
jgi:hypothetical protein